MTKKIPGPAVPIGYQIKLERCDDATVISCPDIPEMNSVAYDDAEITRESLDAIETALIGYMQDRRPIPAARPHRGPMVYLPTLTKAKLALYNAVLEHGLSKAELARRLALPRPSVDRLLDLRHASKMEQMDAALELLGCRLDVQVLAA